MKELLELALETARKAGASYADIRHVTQRNESVSVRNGAVNNISSATDKGFGVRVLANGAWGFASSSRFSHEEVQRVAEQAVSIAKASALVKERDIELAPVKPVVDSYTTPHKTDPFDVKLEDKVNMLLEAERLIREVNGVRISEANLNWNKEQKTFASTEGSYIEQELIECGGGISATAFSLGEMQRRAFPNAHRGHFRKAGWEFVETLQLAENAERVGKESVELLGAKQCPAGDTTVILDGSQMVLQIHESCGHPVELDRVFGTEAAYAGTSFLTPEKKGNFRYGSDIVNITADATLEGGLGTYAYDDEGVPGQRTEIIKEGMFLNYLTSRETAPLVGDAASNGTMRASGWNRIPIVRMSNISLEPGDWTLEEMIKDTKEGIYMETNKSWSIDDKRLNFQFGTEVAWEIKDGELGQMLKNPTYTGITPEFWANCDAIANKDYWTLWGTPNCGKGEPGQVAHVGHGASPSRFRNVKVGVGKW